MAGNSGFSGARRILYGNCLTSVVSNNRRILWLFHHVFAHMPACLRAIYINEALIYTGINNSSTTGRFSTMTASYMDTLAIVAYCAKRSTYYLLQESNRAASDCHFTIERFSHLTVFSLTQFPCYTTHSSKSRPGSFLVS